MLVSAGVRGPHPPPAMLCGLGKHRVALKALGCLLILPNSNQVSLECMNFMITLPEVILEAENHLLVVRCS